MKMRAAVLMILAALPALAQFDLQVVEPAGARSAPPTYNLGSIYRGETVSVRFRLHNPGADPAVVRSIAAGGVGFSVTAPALPATVDPQGALDFQVNFQASDEGSYSAALRAENVTILLTISVQPRLTYRVDDTPLGVGVDFGSVVRGSTARRRFTAVNETGMILIVPAISVTGGDYLFAGPLVSGSSLRPHESLEFAVEFRPSESGPHAGTLGIGDRSYALMGLGTDPPLPKPIVSIDLGQPRSAQQGMLVIQFDRAPTTNGTGTAILEFDGPSDPAIAFASGGRTATFAIAPGDVRAAIPFQTGTTAGTLTFRVRIGDSSDQVVLPIIRTAPLFASVQGSRYGGSLEVRLTGFDNTRTAGPLTFTFFDAAGQAIAPGELHVDATGDFARYFAASDAGGTFVLRAMFPVTGDAAQIAAFEASLSGSAGSARSARIPLP